MLRFKPNDNMSTQVAVRVNDVKFDIVIDSARRQVDVNFIHLCFHMRLFVYVLTSVQQYIGYITAITIKLFLSALTKARTNDLRNGLCGLSIGHVANKFVL